MNKMTVQNSHTCDMMQSTDRKEKIRGILAATETYVEEWFVGKKTGHYTLMLEVNLNEGGVRDVYFSSQVREKRAL